MAARRALWLAGALLALTCAAAVGDDGSKSIEAERASDPSKTVKLNDLIAKKNFEGFVDELGNDGLDPNQPDTKGRLPIFEATKTGEIVYVDSLIQFGSTVNAKDINSGATPLQQAFQQGSVEIAKLLLMYGADPDVEDKKGKKARELATSEALKELLKLYDEQGAMAFEDAPGTWIRARNDKDEPYWYNVITKEARWNVPPSCGWQRIEFQGMPSKFVNYVTGQTIHTTPAALSWRRVRLNGSEVWYNWNLNKTQHEQPDEMPQYLLDEAITHTNVRWFNEKTQEFAWEDPKYHTPWRVVKAENGNDYFYNVRTGESTWDAPEEFAWTQVESEQVKGKFYWFNKKTGESTWEKPHSERWEKHSHDL